MLKAAGLRAEVDLRDEKMGAKIRDAELVKIPYMLVVGPREAGVRVELDLRDEKMGAKIRDAELAKIPYMLVVGPREAEAGTVAPRRKGVGQLEAMTRQAFMELVERDVRARR